MAKEKVEIDRIVIKVGKRELTFSVEEAKNLKELLNDLFGETIKYIEGPVKTVPIWIERPYYWDHRPWVVGAGTGTGDYIGDPPYTITCEWAGTKE
jgi:hypothetical protein